MDKIICLGKNYAEHARELGEPSPERPVIFIKPFSVLCSAANRETKVCAPISTNWGLVHHEAEVVIRIKRDCYRISAEEAGKVMGEVTLGLDMTKRDVQAGLKKKGHPWTISKVFPGSAIIGPWMEGEHLQQWKSLPFSFSVNGALRQKGMIEEMLMPPLASVAYISEFFPLKAGDLIFTGTPAGVGPIKAGDQGQLSWGEDFHFQVEWKEMEKVGA